MTICVYKKQFSDLFMEFLKQNGSYSGRLLLKKGSEKKSLPMLSSKSNVIVLSRFLCDFV